EAIREGRLAAGVRLPATRELARDLGVSRGVVVEAYERLVAEGLLISRVGAGTRVAPAGVRLPGTAARPPRRVRPYYGLRPTTPDLTGFPRERWLAAIKHVLATMPPDALDYADPGGVEELREEIAGRLPRLRAADVHPGNEVNVGRVPEGIIPSSHTRVGRAAGS